MVGWALPVERFWLYCSHNLSTGQTAKELLVIVVRLPEQKGLWGERRPGRGDPLLQELAGLAPALASAWWEHRMETREWNTD